MKYFIISAIALIIVFLAGMKVGSIYFAKTEIKIVKETEYKTVYKYKDLKPINNPIFDIDNFNRLLECYDSPLQFEARTVESVLSVRAFDACKENTIQYEIGSKGNYKIYIGIGVVGVLTGIGLYHYFK
jgi:hypothetical protein